MDFRPSEAERVTRRAVREFAEREIAPDVMVWDEAQRFPMELVPRLAALGLLGIQFPERYGGAGMVRPRLLHLHRGAGAGGSFHRPRGGCP